MLVLVRIAPHMRVHDRHTIDAAHDAQTRRRNMRPDMRHIRAHIGGAFEPQRQNACVRVQREFAFHLHVTAMAVGEEGFHASRRPI